MTEREYRLVIENYILRSKLVSTQGKLRNTRARLRLWRLRQQAWRRERRTLQDELVAMRRAAAATSYSFGEKNRRSSERA